MKVSDSSTEPVTVDHIPVRLKKQFSLKGNLSKEERLRIAKGIWSTTTAGQPTKPEGEREFNVDFARISKMSKQERLGLARGIWQLFSSEVNV